MTGGVAPAVRSTLSVELVGIPGSGKSRLARTLEQALSAEGLAVDLLRTPLLPPVPTGLRLARKALACGGVAARAPVGSLRLGRAVVRSAQPGPADVAGRLVQVLVGRSLLTRAARTPGVAVLDEGLLQAIWSTGLRGDVDPLLSAVERQRAIPWPDLLVVVRLAPHLAAARLAGRSSRNSRTQLLEDDDRLAELRRGAELLDRVVTWFVARTACRSEVFVVDGTEEDGNDRSRLIELLRERMR